MGIPQHRPPAKARRGGSSLQTQTIHLGSRLDWQTLLDASYRHFPKVTTRVVPSGRQVGKTWYASRRATRVGLVTPPDEVNLYITPTYILGRRPFQLVNALVRVYNLGKPNRASRIIRWANGAETHWLTSSDPEKLVSQTVRIEGIFDEAGKTPDAAFFNADAMFARWDAMKLLIGTPMGARGYYYDCWRRGLAADGTSPILSWDGKRFTKSPVDPTYLSLSLPSWVTSWGRERAAAAKRDLPRPLWLQDWGAQFLEEGQRLLGFYHQVCTRHPEPAVKGARYVLAWDPARTTDISDLRVFRVSHSPELWGWEVARRRMENTDWPQQFEIVDAVAKEYGTTLIHVDVTGRVGATAEEGLRARGYRVKPYTFSKATKPDLIEFYISSGQHRRFELLTQDDDPEGWAEGMEFTYELSEPEGGLVAVKRIVYGHPPGGHDDSVDARALGVWILGKYLRTSPYGD